MLIQIKLQMQGKQLLCRL